MAQDCVIAFHEGQLESSEFLHCLSLTQAITSRPSSRYRHASMRTHEERFLLRSVQVGLARFSRCCHLFGALGPCCWQFRTQRFGFLRIQLAHIAAAQAALELLARLRALFTKSTCAPACRIGTKGMTLIIRSAECDDRKSLVRSRTSD